VSDFAADSGLQELSTAARAGPVAVLDLRPIRSMSQKAGVSPAVARYVNGFDALVVLNSSTADAPLIM
jgi:hypothetical protein